MDTTEHVTGGRWQQNGWGLIQGAAPRRRRRAGFTMIEVMVAIGVLLVATAAAFGSQIASFGVISSSRDQSTAMTDLEVCMEMLLAESLDGMVADYPDGVPVPAFAGAHLRDQVITPSYAGLVAMQPVPNPLDIVLTATWSDARGRPQRLLLRTQATQ